MSNSFWLGSDTVQVKAELSKSLINEAHCHEDVWGSEGIAPPFLMELTGQLHALDDLPGERAPVPIGHKGGWPPEPVWTLWRRDKSLTRAGNQTPAVQPVAHHYTD
jgi:hypothetical protein